MARRHCRLAISRYDIDATYIFSGMHLIFTIENNICKYMQIYANLPKKSSLQGLSCDEEKREIIVVTNQVTLCRRGVEEPRFIVAC